jgi:hypothetical protein
MPQNTEHEGNPDIDILREYIVTMPMSSVWIQIIAVTHVGEVIFDLDAVDLVMEKLSAHPKAAHDLVAGLVYVGTAHADDIRAQTEAIINSFKKEV